ncbi:hypothetical protein LZD49_31630 [Dyadobacter sp. CY261]|uniref:hypothetical protein n=1 Tax=Dyadobacter sp. CY261 TaxID=2907203 RepID=UPI001F3981EC|nr:hypothetical protein [Dyadobacter sp. CY261]MCF0075078.1 hypothetical protein [Dyadobacter sp. CY261]
MKKIYILILFIHCCAFSFAQGQGEESIYFATGTKVKGKIESADDEKISTILENGSHYMGLRDKFVIFFNKSGDYLTEKNISKEPARAQAEIQEFYTAATAAKPLNDILFKASPREVIACNISNELEDVINYLTLDGRSASINKDNLFAVIRRNGTHEMLRDLPEVADNLSVMKKDFNNSRLQEKKSEPVSVLPAKPPVAVATVPEVRPAEAAKVPEKERETEKEKKRLTTDEQKTYMAKSEDKMLELANLLNSIVDARRSRSEKDIAIQKAVKMFVKDATVEVSAVNNPNNKTKRNVAEYLTRLSRLSYSKVNITYAEINFVQEFEPDDQGNFWGIAEYSQTFATNNFHDVTQKRQKIKLQPYEKTVDGMKQDKFEVLMGNISINVSQ